MNIKNLGVIAKKNKKEVAPLFMELKKWCNKNSCSFIAEEWLKSVGDADQFLTRREVGPASDVLIVLGGDGTLLSAINVEGGRIPPIVGVNLGGLGFLTEISKDEMTSALNSIVKGEMEFSKRACLDIELTRDGSTKGKWTALNDVVVNKGALARMIVLDAWVDGGHMTTYRSDGIIVATPTGSTAYAMAAGGPIVSPEVGCIIITPICPHTLTQRTMVIRDERILEISVVSSGEVYLTVDGQRGCDLSEGDTVKVKRSKVEVQLVRSPKLGYFDILRQKLRWGER